MTGILRVWQPYYEDNNHTTTTNNDRLAIIQPESREAFEAIDKIAHACSHKTFKAIVGGHVDLSSLDVQRMYDDMGLLSFKDLHDQLRTHLFTTAATQVEDNLRLLLNKPLQLTNGEQFKKAWTNAHEIEIPASLMPSLVEKYAEIKRMVVNAWK